MDETLRQRLKEHLDYIETTLQGFAIQIRADLTQNKLEQDNLGRDIVSLEQKIEKAQTAHNAAEHRRCEIDTHDLEMLSEDDFSGQSNFNFTPKNLESECKIRIESSLPIREYYQRFSSGATWKDAKCNKNKRMFYAEFAIKPQQSTSIAVELYTWRTDRNAREVAELRRTKQELEEYMNLERSEWQRMLEKLAALYDVEQECGRLLGICEKDMCIVNDACSSELSLLSSTEEELCCYLRAGSMEGVAKVFDLSSLVGTEHFELEGQDRSHFMEVVRIARENTQQVATQLQHNLTQAEKLQWDTESILHRLDDLANLDDLNLDISLPFTINDATESSLAEMTRLDAKRDLLQMQVTYDEARVEVALQLSKIKDEGDALEQKFMPAERSQEEDAVRKDLKDTENQAQAMLLAGGAIVQQPRPIGVVAALKHAKSAAEAWLPLFEGRNLCMAASV